MLPVQGFDPTAFHNGPTPLASGAPTMSPSELHTPVPSSAAAALPLAPEAPASEGPIAVFTKEQQKFALSLLRSLKKHRLAAPFLRPVDPIALLIPDYFRVVTRPMDIGTVENKLNQTGKAMAQAQKTGRIYGVDYGGVGEWEGKREEVYRTAEEFREDVESVWENCFKYNGPKEKNPVSAMAGTLQEVCEKMWRNMPPAPAVEVSSFLLSLRGGSELIVVCIAVQARACSPSFSRDHQEGAPSAFILRPLFLSPNLPPPLLSALDFLRPHDPSLRRRSSPEARDPRACTRARLLGPAGRRGLGQEQARARQRQGGAGAVEVLQGGRQGDVQEGA